MKVKILIPASILLFSITFLVLSHIYVSSNAGKELDYATNILQREVLLRGSLIEAAYNRNELRVAYSYLKGFTIDPDIRTTRLIAASGKILLSLSPSEEGKDIQNISLDRINDHDLDEAFTRHQPFTRFNQQKKILEIAYQISLNTSIHSLRPNSSGLLVVRKDISRDLALYQHKETLFAYISAAVFSILSLLLWFMLDHQITRPITDLRRITQRIAAGEFHVRTTYHSKNEIGRLAFDINHMAEALEQIQNQYSTNLTRLQTSQRYGAIGNWEWNIVSGEIIWSEEEYQLFGVHPDEFEPTFESFLNLIAEEDRDKVEQALTNALKNNTPYYIRHRVYRNGQVCWLLEQGDTVRDEAGNPQRMLGTSQDITQQVNYENDLKLAHQELNYQVAALDEHGIVSVTDADGVIIYCNKKFQEISGYSTAELLGHKHIVINSGYHDAEFWRRFWTIASSGNVWEGEICNRRKDGSLFWVKTTIVPHLGEDGLPDRYTGISTDITALKNAQQALSEEHAQLQAVAAINNTFLSSEDQQQIFQAILEIYLRHTQSTFGFIGSISSSPDDQQNILTVQAIKNRGWDEKHAQESLHLANSSMALSQLDGLYGHVIGNGDHYIQNDVGNGPYAGSLDKLQVKLENFCGMPLYYGNEFIGMIAMANRTGGFTDSLLQRLTRLNIETARIMHDVSLRQYNRRLLHAINHSSSEIFIVEPENLRILDSNPAACDNLGYSLEELKRLSFDDITLMTEGHRNLLKKLGANTNELVAEFEHLRKDGSRYPVESHIQLVTDVHPPLLVAIIQDISERKTSEQRYHEIQRQLFQSQKMEALGHLTGGIAHDFNNMLASILGYTELSLDLIARYSDNTSKVQGYLHQVITASKRARDLITQMLSFSRTRTDSQDNITNVKPVISEVITLLRSSLPATMQLNYEIEPNLPSAHIQPVQLHQILMNLCINARDAMDGVGDVKIEASQCDTHSIICSGCHNSFNGHYVCIKVIDNGTGIPADSLERIFEPFYTTKETGKGTGMGLSVVHGIVHGNDGHIRVESTVGEGTAFMIYLPISERQDDLGEQQGSLYAPYKLDGTRAVVVDDDTSVGNFLKEMLELNDISTTYFSDSRAALQYLLEHHQDYDVLISDMTMPYLTGLQLSEQLFQAGSQLPVFLCSGYNSEKIDQDKCEELGIRACLTKPVDTRELLKLLADVVRVKSA